MSKYQVVTVVLMSFLMAVLCFGCASTEPEKVQSVSETTPGPVTGMAVSGGGIEDFLKEIPVEEGRQPQRYASDNAIYQLETNAISQYDKASGRKKSFPTKITDLLYVSEDAMYFSQSSDEVPRDIYRAPLKKQEDGSETVEFGESKKILDVPDGVLNIYAYSHYVVYMDYKTQEYLHCYDFESGQDYKAEIDGLGIDFKYGLGDSVILCSMNQEGYWCFDISTHRLVHFEKDIASYEFYPGVRADNAFFYDREGDIYVYDIKREKRCRLLSEKKLDKFCKENSAEKESFLYSSVGQLFVSEGRLYIQMTKTWVDNKRTERTNHMVLSLDLLAENKELRYEKNLSEFIGNNGTWYEQDDEDGEYNSSGIFCVAGEDAIVVINGGDGEYDWENDWYDWEMYCWNLSTGEKKRIRKQDREYYLPYANEEYLDAALEDEFDWNVEC